MSKKDMPMTRRAINALRLELHSEVADDAVPLLHGLADSYEDALAQIAALTQRAEQTEEDLNTVYAHVKEALELLGVDVSVNGYIPDSWTLREQCHLAGKRLAAAEAEVKRLREGIRALANEAHPYCNLNINPDWLADELKALLAQPSDGKEATDAQ